MTLDRETLQAVRKELVAQVDALANLPDDVKLTAAQVRALVSLETRMANWFHSRLASLASPASSPRVETETRDCRCTHLRIDHGTEGTWCGYPDCNCSRYRPASPSPEPAQDMDEHHCEDCRMPNTCNVSRRCEAWHAIQAQKQRPEPAQDGARETLDALRQAHENGLAMNWTPPQQAERERLQAEIRLKDRQIAGLISSLDAAHERTTKAEAESLALAARLATALSPTPVEGQ